MLNKALLIGRLVAAPVMIYTPAGQPQTTFDLVTTQTRINHRTGERFDDMMVHRIVLWDRLAERANASLEQGHLCFVEGPLVFHSYADKAGVKRLRPEVLTTQLIVLGYP